MSHLLLRTRLEALRGSLQQVGAIRQAVMRREKELRDLRESLDGIETACKKIKHELNLAAAWLDPEAGHMGEESAARAHVDSAVERTTASIQALKRLREAGGGLDEICRRIVVVGEEKLGNTLEGTLESMAATCLSELEAIQLERHGEARQAVLEQAWTAYAAKEEESEPLLAEYVDFLQGWALRESGFDEGVCRIADRLLGVCDKMGQFRWESLTIPDFNEATVNSVARIVRLGFPEWTIWVAPLAAHSVGRVVASSHTKLEECRQEVDGDARARGLLEHCLADIYATYAMGPAYACAAILMRLDPRTRLRGGEEIPPDLERAYVVLGTLEHENDSDPDAPYTGVLEELKAAWTEALVQNGQAPQLAAATREKLDRWLELMNEDFLNNECKTTRYLPSSWKDNRAWVDEILRAADAIDEWLEGEGGSEKAPSVKLTEDLRDVLNAAWQCRLNRPDAAEEIARTALYLCRHVLDGRPAGRRGGLDTRRTPEARPTGAPRTSPQTQRGEHAPRQ